MWRSVVTLGMPQQGRGRRVANDTSFTSNTCTDDCRRNKRVRKKSFFLYFQPVAVLINAIIVLSWKDNSCPATKSYNINSTYTNTSDKKSMSLLRINGGSFRRYSREKRISRPRAIMGIAPWTELCLSTRTIFPPGGIFLPPLLYVIVAIGIGCISGDDFNGP